MLNFDPQIVQEADIKDVGPAVSGMYTSPTQQLGTAQAAFPAQVTYQAIGVHGSPSNNIGTSKKIDAIVLPSTSTTISGATPTPQPTSVSSQHGATIDRTSNARPLLPPLDPKLVIIGSILSAFVVFAIIMLLIMFLVRRRQEPKVGWIFHPKTMVQILQPPPSQSISRSANIAPHSQDLERGLHGPAPVVPLMHRLNQDPGRGLSDPVPYPIPAVVGPRGPRARRPDSSPPCAPLPPLPITHRSPFIPRSPLSPRSSSRSALVPESPRLRLPMPRSSSPRTHRQRMIADQIETLRTQMLEFEQTGGKDGGADPVMDEMCKKMAWLREQQEGPWALGLTEVTPLGYDHYIT